MHKLYKQSGSDLIDISNFCGNIIRRSTQHEVSEELDFNIIHDDVYKLSTTIEEGDIIILKSNDKILLKAVLITREIAQRKETTIRCFDFGYYLNKNEDAYQFDSSVSDNMKKIMNDYGIKIGNIVEIPTIFKKVTRGTLSTIINEMLELAEKEQGKKYIWEMREDAFFLEELDTNVVTYTSDEILTSSNDAENINKYLGKIRRKVSIEGLYNAIKVAGESKNKVRDLAYKEDAETIKKYGKMQKLEFLDKGDYGKAASIAINQLATLNKVQDNLTITLLGNDDCRANRVLEITDTVTGAKGKYLIVGCTHNINDIHLMDLELEVI